MHKLTTVTECASKERGRYKHGGRWYLKLVGPHGPVHEDYCPHFRTKEEAEAWKKWEA